MLKIFDKRYNPDGQEESYQLSIFAMITLVFLMVVSVMYALYLFIHAMGISDIAGVHISKNLMLEVKSVQGKLYTNEEKNIKDWIIYANDSIGVDIKYPNDLSLTNMSENELEIKSVIPNADPKVQSLQYVLLFGKKEAVENLTAQDFIKNKFPEAEGGIKNVFYGEKEGVRTGVFKAESGIYKEIVCWKLENKIIYAESRYYSQNYTESANMFEKIISEINIR